MAEGQKMKGLPMTGWCVRALLAGAKSETRRVIKRVPPEANMALALVDGRWEFCQDVVREYFDNSTFIAPHYQPGDLVYIKEALVPFDIPEWPDEPMTQYEADKATTCIDVGYGDDSWLPWFRKVKRLPSIFMPKIAARIFRRIASVRAERLQDITEAGARAEGVIHDIVAINATGEHPKGRMPRIDTINAYSILWDELNAKSSYPWESNPWVWVYGLEEVEDEPE